MPQDVAASTTGQLATKLLTEQCTLIDAMHRIIENFKKLGQAKFTASKAHARLETLKELWSRCTNVHIQLLQTIPEGQRAAITYFKNEEYLEAEMMKEEIADYFLDIADKCAGNGESSMRIPNASSFSHDSDQGSVPSFVPRVELPLFSGCILEWESFRDLFESVIIRNTSIGSS